MQQKRTLEEERSRALAAAGSAHTHAGLRPRAAQGRRSLGGRARRDRAGAHLTPPRTPRAPKGTGVVLPLTPPYPPLLPLRAAGRDQRAPFLRWLDSWDLERSMDWLGSGLGQG